MQNSSSFVHASSGTPAGSALGDAMFLLAFAGVGRSIQKELVANDLVFHATIPEAIASVSGLQTDVPFEPALYMDDVEIPCFGLADLIELRASAVATIAKSTLKKHWLVMNTAQGKSEAMFFLFGKGADKTRKKLSCSDPRRRLPWPHLVLVSSLALCGSTSTSGRRSRWGRA